MSKKLFQAWVDLTDWALFRFYVMRGVFDCKSPGINGVGLQIGPVFVQFVWGEDLGTCWEDGYDIEITD